MQLFQRLRGLQSFHGREVLLTLIALNMAIERLCPPDFGIAAADRWKPYIVVDSICMGILLIADGFPPEAVLLALTVIYVLAGIITEGEAFAGFSSPGVLAFGALFVLSEAFAEVPRAELLHSFARFVVRSWEAPRFHFNPLVRKLAVANTGQSTGCNNLPLFGKPENAPGGAVPNNGTCCCAVCIFQQWSACGHAGADSTGVGTTPRTFSCAAPHASCICIDLGWNFDHHRLGGESAGA